MKLALLVGIAAIALTVTAFFARNKSLPAAAIQSYTNSLPSEPAVVDKTTSPLNYKIQKKTVYRLNLNIDNSVILLGEIGSNAQNVAQEILQKSRKGYPIYLLINSPGGSVLDGVAIIDAIQGAPGPVYTVCLEFCASMAAVTFSYGTERLMADRSFLMYHQAAGSVEGSFNQIRSRFSALEHYVNKMDYEIASRAGMDPEQFKNMLSDEIWWDADESIRRHFADKLVVIAIEIPESNSFSKERLSQTKTLKDTIKINLSN